MPGQPTDRDEDWLEREDVEVAPRKSWGERAQVISAVLWSSFLAACFATLLFFAFVDPGLIHEFSTPQIEMTRMTGYGIGFFFFWVVSAISSAVSVYLIRTSHLSDRGAAPPK